MPDKKCPMCNGACVLKILMSDSKDAKEVDVCSLCGAKYPRESGHDRDM